MFEAQRDKEVEAAAFESAVRQALVKVYGKPLDPTTGWRSVLSSFLPKGARLEYTKPDPLAVLILTEFSWVQDPWLSKVDFSRWQKVSGILAQQGWKNPGWDSINPAVHVIWAEAPPSPSMGGLDDIPLPPNIERPEMWTTKDIVRAVGNGFTFMIPFVMGESLFSQNGYWIGGLQYGSSGLTVGPDHTPEIKVIEPDQWLRAKTYFRPEMVPEKSWAGRPNENGVVAVYLEIDPETIDWELLNRGYQIRTNRIF